MAANYLYGPRTIEVENGTRSIRTVKSAVIGPIGTTLMGDVDTLTQYLSEKGATAPDSQFTSFTTPQALDMIYDHGAGTVLIINALDPVKHKTAIEDEVVTFDGPAGQVRLAHPVITNVVMKNSEGSTTYTANTNYRVDAQASVLTNLGKAVEADGSVKVSYEYADPSKATAANIVGGVNSAGNRTGMKLPNNSFSLYGYFAKALIVPVFCTQRDVAVEFTTMAEKLGTITYIDAPVDTTLAQALAGRGLEDTISFNTSSDHIRLCHPHVKVYDPVTNTERLEPLSQHAVGLRARVNLDRGCWRSSPSQEILGITGMERQLSAMIDDPQSRVNLLSEQGITTVFNGCGGGLRLWDNQMAVWPTVTHMRNFENVRRTGDIIDESIRYFSQQCIDMLITQALVDVLTESVNAYGRKMTSDGAILGFHCWFDLACNPGTELAAGHLLLSYKYTPPPPLERLTSETEVTSEYLLTLKGDD